MSDAKNLAEANQWCHAARELLGKKKGKSKALKGAKAQIKEADQTTDKLLAQLLGLNDAAYRRLLAQYLQLAGKIEVATHGGTVKEAALVEAGQSLAALNLSIQQAVDAESKLAKDLTKFDDAYTKREPLVASGGALRGATLPGGAVRVALDLAEQCMEEAWALRTAAQDQHAPDKLVEAHTKLKAVGTALDDAKVKSKLAEKEAAEDLSAMGDWSRLKPLVEQAIALLKPLQGAEDALASLQDKLDTALALLVTHNGVTQGYKAASAALAGHAELLAKGRQDSSEFLKKDLPTDVTQALSRVTDALPAHEALAPPYASQSLRNQAQTASQLGRRDAAAAVKQLGELLTQVNSETDQLGKDKRLAEAANGRLADLIETLKSRGAPQILYQAAQNTLDAVRSGEMIDRQWSTATRRLGGASQGVQTLSDAYATHGADWERKRTELQAIHTLAVQAQIYPVLQIFGQRLRTVCDEVRQPFDRFELAASIAAFDTQTVSVPKGTGTVAMTLTLAHAEMKERIRAGKLPVEDEGKRQTFAEQLKYGANIVKGAHADAQARLLTYADGLKGVEPAKLALLQRDMSTRLDEIYGLWVSARNEASDAKALESATSAAIKSFKKLVDDQVAITGSKLERAIVKLKEADAVDKNKAAPERMAKMLADCKARGIAVADEERLVDAQKSAPTKDYRDIYAKLEIKWSKYLEEQRLARQKLAEEMRRDVTLKLIDLPISKTLKKELEQAGNDVSMMINTTDAELLAVAQGMKDRLQKQIEAIGASPKLHERNTDALDALSGRIGDLLDKLPDTNRRLRTRLDEERVQAKHNLPSVMQARIKLLTQEVEQGEKELEERDAAVAKYRDLKTEVRAAFDQMKKATATRLTEKSDAFEAWYEARIAEAKAFKGQQGRIPDAMRILLDLKSKLAAINVAENPRAVLRQLDANEVQNHRTMVDLALQWQKDVSFFLDVTLAKASEANKGKGKDGDASTISGLEDLVGAAGKVVGSYLKELTTLKIGAVKGPDINKVKADFAQARQMLGNAERSALRLTEAPQSTNVRSPAKDGLPKLLRKWSERTQGYASTLRGVAEAVRTAAKGDPDPVKSNADKAARMIDDLIPLFRSEAFATSFGVLMQEPADEQQRVALGKQQLAARESALRLMRQYRNELAHPLLRRLADPASNPFDAVNVTVAVSGLATTLKEIELQALASA